MDQGLTESEVLKKISLGQSNRIKKTTTRTIPAILRNNILTVFNGVLSISVAALFIIRANVDAVFLLVVTGCNILLGIVEELRAKWALDKLEFLQRKKVKVIREGTEKIVDAENIVKSDLIVFEQGDQIIADGELLASSITVDESFLSGEQDPIEKNKGDLLYSGSIIVSGVGRYRVLKVGKHANINILAEQAKNYKYAKTPLQREINYLIQGFTGIMVLFILLLLTAHFIKNLSVSTSVLSIVTIIKSLVPEGLVLISTLSLALGAYRVAKNYVLVQKINAIEAMSHLTTLCLDKTGTLGTNLLKFEELISFLNKEEVVHKLKLYLGATQDRNPTTLAIEEKFSSPKIDFIEKMSFSSQKKISAVTVQNGKEKITLWLGAPEVLSDHLTFEEINILKEKRAMGLRVLLFATSKSSIKEKKELTHLAFIVLKDELRPEIKKAIIFFERRGVNIKVLSGDHPDTVFALCQQVGITIKGKIISGKDLENLSSKEFERMVQEGQFFGSLLPRQKEQIIKHLQILGEYVGMVGDGVNDIFALKQANIGVAMNSGVSSAKDIADIILLKNSFSHLPSLSEEGDRIIYNIKRVSNLFLTKNIYCLFFILFVGFVGLEFPLSPRFITWIDVLTIGIPTTILTLMNPVLKKQSVNLFIYNLLKFAVSAGITIAFFSLLAYVNFSIFQDREELYGKTAAISVIIIMSLYVVYYVTEIERKESYLSTMIVWLILIGSFILLFTSLYWPLPQKLLNLSPIDIDSWGTICLIAITGIFFVRYILKRVTAKTMLFGKQS
jgi:cation-transporting ATPase E